MSNEKTDELVDKAKTRTVSLKSSTWEFIDKYCGDKYMKTSNLIQRAVDELIVKLKHEESTEQK